MSDAPQNPHEGADEASKQEKPLLVIHNFHNPNCGEPPSYVVKLETTGYYGYFENHYGEQWVFVYDYDIPATDYCRL